MLKLSTSPEMLQDLFAFYGYTKESLEKVFSDKLHENVQLVYTEHFGVAKYRDFDFSMRFNHKTMEYSLYLTELRGKKLETPRLLVKNKPTGSAAKLWKREE
jgi:hypothetical protein